MARQIVDREVTKPRRFTEQMKVFLARASARSPHTNSTRTLPRNFSRLRIKMGPSSAVERTWVPPAGAAVQAFDLLNAQHSRT